MDTAHGSTDSVQGLDIVQVIVDISETDSDAGELETKQASEVYYDNLRDRNLSEEDRPRLHVGYMSAMTAQIARTTTPNKVAHLLPRAKQGDDPNPNGRKPPKNPRLDVVHTQLPDYIVVNKPPDVRMDGPFNHTVESLVLIYLNSILFDTQTTSFGLRFVQRLDYATSGVLLIALTRPAAAVASAQFEQRTVHKVYAALVHGHIFPPGGEDFLTFDQPIADEHNESFRMTVGSASNPGRKSLTKCRVLQHGFYHDAPVSKVLLFPQTGRRHQLRVHCAHAGMPIVGDATYADDDCAYYGEDFIPPRMMLHAMRLELRLGAVVRGRKRRVIGGVKKQFLAGDPFLESELHDLHFGFLRNGD